LSIFAVPEISGWETSRVKVEPSTKTAKVNIPKSIFNSEVGGIKKVLLLIEELVSHVPH
jgi:hypothetical protein